MGPFELPADADGVVVRALAEDLGVEESALVRGHGGLLVRDVTTSALLGEDVRFVGRVVARERCVIAGLPLAARAFEILAAAEGLWDESVDVFPLVAEGAQVPAGTAVAEVDGLASVVLAAERTALNLLQTLSGIATETRRWQDAAGTALTVMDSRKTWPGLRSLSKYAVRVGGGGNHRAGLHDAVLAKDNHLRHVTVSRAVASARSAHPDLFVQIEADSISQALEAVEAGADGVLLDNFDGAVLAESVSLLRERAASRGRSCVIEVSGGVSFERLPAIAVSGADRVSTSRITLARPVDIALDAD